MTDPVRPKATGVDKYHTHLHRLIEQNPTPPKHRRSH